MSSSEGEKSDGFDEEGQDGYESSSSSGSSSSGSTLFSDIEYAENLKDVDIMVSQRLEPEPPNVYDTSTVESSFAGITMKVMAADVQHMADQYADGYQSGCRDSLEAHVRQYLQYQPVIFAGIRMTRTDAENIPPLGICGPLAGFATSSLPHVRRCSQLDLDDYDTRGSFVEYLDDILSPKYANITCPCRESLMIKLRGIRSHIVNGGSSSISSSTGLWLDQFETQFLCSLKTKSVMWVQSSSDETLLMLTIGSDKIPKVSWSSTSIEEFFHHDLSHFMLASRHFGRVTFPFNKSDLQRVFHTLSYRLIAEVKRYFEAKSILFDYNPVVDKIVESPSVISTDSTVDSSANAVAITTDEVSNPVASVTVVEVAEVSDVKQTDDDCVNDAPMTVADLRDEDCSPLRSEDVADEEVYSASVRDASDMVLYSTPPIKIGKHDVGGALTVKKMAEDQWHDNRKEEYCASAPPIISGKETFETQYTRHVESLGIETKTLQQQFLMGGKGLTLVLDGQYSIIAGLHQTWMRSEFDVGRNGGSIYNNEPYTVCFHGRRVWMRFCEYQKEGAPNIIVCAVLRSSCPKTNLMLIVKMSDGSFQRFEMHKEEAQWLYEYMPHPEVPLDVTTLFKELAIFTKDAKMDFSRSRAIDSKLERVDPDNDTSGFIFIKDKNVSCRYESKFSFDLPHCLDRDGLHVRFCNVLIKIINGEVVEIHSGDPFPCRTFIDDENMRCIFVGAFVIMCSLDTYNIKFYL